jgi:hypothetical protein
MSFPPPPNPRFAPPPGAGRFPPPPGSQAAPQQQQQPGGGFAPPPPGNSNPPTFAMGGGGSGAATTAAPSHAPPPPGAQNGGVTQLNTAMGNLSMQQQRSPYGAASPAGGHAPYGAAPGCVLLIFWQFCAGRDSLFPLVLVLVDAATHLDSLPNFSSWTGLDSIRCSRPCSGLLERRRLIRALRCSRQPSSPPRVLGTLLRLRMEEEEVPARPCSSPPRP